MPFPSFKSSPAAEPLADLRTAPQAAPFDPNLDIVARLRGLDSRTPFAMSVIEEAAGEIERLRAAIGKHRAEVWGSDEPDHASDAELYRAIR